MILNVSNLSKAYGEHVLLDGASFSVEKGDIVGLIGANGAGKTTLFNMITGREDPDGGSIVFSPNRRLGYLEQHVCANSDLTTYQETIGIFHELFAMEEELSELHKKIDAGDASLIERQDTLTEEYQSWGGLTFRAMTRSVLSGLGFSDEEQELPVSALSGGQKSKIGLAKLLLQKKRNSAKWSGRTSCFWMSRQTIWISTRWTGWKSSSPGAESRHWSSPTTGIFSTGSARRWRKLTPGKST